MVPRPIFLNRAVYIKRRSLFANVAARFNRAVAAPPPVARLLLPGWFFFAPFFPALLHPQAHRIVNAVKSSAKKNHPGKQLAERTPIPPKIKRSNAKKRGPKASLYKRNEKSKNTCKTIHTSYRQAATNHHPLYQNSSHNYQHQLHNCCTPP